MKHRTIKGLAALLLCVLCLTLSLMGCGEKSANEGSTQKAPAGMELESADEQAVILELTDQAMTLAAADYDGDDPESFASEIKEVQLADEVTVWNLDVQTVIDEDGEETTEKTWSMLTLAEVGELLDYGPVSVYLWYDDEGCIQKLLVWGETIVWK